MNAVSRGATHNNAETLFVEAAGVEFAYRRFGSPAELPLVMLQHFRGNLDNWDRALTDALAAEREVILVDYAGVGSSHRRAEPHDRGDCAADDRVRGRARPRRDRPARVESWTASAPTTSTGNVHGAVEAEIGA
jgi:pimeloyl-ACP methyl ester carboxylesterase